MDVSFFEGQVRSLLKRCRILRDHLSKLDNLPEELQTYGNKLDEELQDLEKQVQNILVDPDFGAKQVLKNQIDEYKRFNESLQLLEYFPLTLLYSYNQKDYHFYKFSRLLCKQIGYPYSPPLVSTHSTEYYYAFAAANMVGVPLCENEFLLSLPDLIHELGHLYYSENRNLIFWPFADTLHQYLHEQKLQLKDRDSSQAYQSLLDVLEMVWLQNYIKEFFCDMFATVIVGPA